MKTLFGILFERCPPLFSNDEKKENKKWVGFRVPDHRILDRRDFWISTIRRLVESSSDGIPSQEAGASALDQIVNKQFDVSDDSGGKIVKFRTPINLYPRILTRVEALLESENRQQPVPNGEPPRIAEATGPSLIVDFQRLNKQRQ